MEEQVTPQLENKERTVEEILKDMGSGFMTALPAICAVGIGIWWLFSGAIQIVPTELKLTDKIGVVTFQVFLAVTYCQLLASGGFKSAKNTKAYKQNAERWTRAINKGNTCKKEIKLYAEDIAIKNQKDLREENLEKNGLRYCDYFDEEGKLIYLDYKKSKFLTRHQKNIIDRCVALRIDIPEMFGNISSKWFGVKRRKTQKEYEIKTSISNTIIRMALSIVSVGFMFKFLGFSTETFLYALFQLVMWTGSGILQRMKNYDFIMKEILPQIVENYLCIEGFLDLEDSKKQDYSYRVIENEAKRNRLLIEMKGDI